ncbi:MAG TPA: YraN family protein [Thermoanaerobaculia bacterium]|nr:YraN family protein [Thermoanaerobaculia bacterium]
MSTGSEAATLRSARDRGRPAPRKATGALGRALRTAFGPADLGRAGERRAAWYLRLRGYRILARNVRFRDGELDLVVRRGRRVAFVEVKTRQQTRRGEALEAVDRPKQLRIAQLAERYCAANPLEACHLHFDVVTLFWTGWRFRIRHLEDAFVVLSEPGRPWRMR